jgi:hypothetical protein
MDSGETGIRMKAITIQLIGTSEEYQIEKTPAVGSCDEDEGRVGAQGSTEIYIERRRPDDRPQREMGKSGGKRR